MSIAIMPTTVKTSSRIGRKSTESLSATRRSRQARDHDEVRTGARRPRPPSASPTARTSRVPMITPSAIAPTCAACSGVPMPKPTATGTGESACVAATSSPSAAGSRSRSPVVRCRRRGRRTLGRGADPRAALRRRRRGDERDQREPGRAQRGARSRRPPRAAGRARSRPAAPASASSRANALGAAGQDHVRVGHRDTGRRAASRSQIASTDVERRAAGERRGRRRHGSPGRRRAGRRTGRRARSGRRPRRHRPRHRERRSPRSGKPPIRYGISAARPSAARRLEGGGDPLGPVGHRRRSSPERRATSAGPCRRGR